MKVCNTHEAPYVSTWSVDGLTLAAVIMLLLFLCPWVLTSAFFIAFFSAFVTGQIVTRMLN